ncbi:nitrate/sulfonate/bicarbonate ABC transporter, ATP-binding protein [Campylobacter pinnipediorum subsp. caledonicus]|uniref:Nitrate/sulfonate/bicarbonate ABC transporter, ATP-binding protein n=1 Tax=Campylobacter pinnipediorum subsp. caledonicus TaxID=1874362 RepID=A0A1S6U816_9BACT|nr:ABC transporter ATP-binding protein [Campylobacter pinnipediorum]AQW87812.1 nitrate/sulfonate/bicarbonate ABC transporter, ATP-binding protein [Campylobacter pinnipediorum subsp. caledonicus]
MKLRLKEISHSFGDTHILKNINFHINKNEIVSIIGPSGCGKSTIFNIAAGLINPSFGQVLLDDKDITGKSGNVGYMLQKDLLLPFKTVLENVALPQIIKGKSKSEAYSKAMSYFKEFGLDGMQNEYPKMLSGGMRQRAALLRTYLFEKDLILLDEPFSALDAMTKESIHNWYLDVVRDMKLTTLFITHDIEEAILLSDRIYILDKKPASLSQEILVPLLRPRDALSDDIIKIKREIKNKFFSI